MSEEYGSWVSGFHATVSVVGGLGDSMEDLQQEIGDLSNDLSIVSEVCQVTGRHAF